MASYLREPTWPKTALSRLRPFVTNPRRWSWRHATQGMGGSAPTRSDSPPTTKRGKRREGASHPTNWNLPAIVAPPARQIRATTTTRKLGWLTTRRRRRRWAPPISAQSNRANLKIISLTELLRNVSYPMARDSWHVQGGAKLFLAARPSMQVGEVGGDHTLATPSPGRGLGWAGSRSGRVAPRAV